MAPHVIGSLLLIVICAGICIPLLINRHPAHIRLAAVGILIAITGLLLIANHSVPEGLLAVALGTYVITQRKAGA